MKERFRPRPRESEIQAGVIEYLQLKGYFTMRLNSGAVKSEHGGYMRLAPAGTPDVMAFKQFNTVTDYDTTVEPTRVTVFPTATLLFIECKVPGNKPTKLQEEKMKELESFGARCLVIHSIEELMEQL